MKAKLKAKKKLLTILALIVLFSLLPGYFVYGYVTRKIIAKDINDYVEGMKICLEDTINSSEYNDLIVEHSITIVPSLERVSSKTSTYGEFYKNFNIIIHLNDEYDGLKFKEQYDVAYGLYELIRKTIHENDQNYRLFNYWFSDKHIDQYCEANAIKTVFQRGGIDYFLETSENQYSTNKEGTFVINETEYSGKEFNYKYGKEINLGGTNSSPSIIVKNQTINNSIRCWYCSKVIYNNGVAIHCTHKFDRTYTCDYCGKDNLID